MLGQKTLVLCMHTLVLNMQYLMPTDSVLAGQKNGTTIPYIRFCRLWSDVVVNKPNLVVIIGFSRDLVVKLVTSPRKMICLGPAGAFP